MRIRAALHSVFPQYPVDAIAIIPEPIEEHVMKLADNLLPLELAIDIGRQTNPISEEHSEALRKKLISYIPELKGINFGIWIREFPSNGFTEHKPE